VKWIVLACATLVAAWVAACANFPPADDRSFPGAGQPAVDERRESRALELAESNCVSQGKNAEAARVEGQMVYNCVER
jgi:putative hemolysin